MKVIATAVGYDNIKLREVGEVFDCPKNGEGEEITQAKWYKPAPKSKAKVAAPPVDEDNGKEQPIT